TRCCSRPACSSSGSATRPMSAGARCCTGPRTTRRSRPARPCGSSCPACASSPWARRSRCSTTRSTKSATRPCGRSGACGGTVSSAPGDDVLGAAAAADTAPWAPDGSVLSVHDLVVDYTMERGTVRAVDSVSFDLDPSEFLGIVGESGCGKSTLLFALAQLLVPPAAITSGSVAFKGQNMVGLTDRQLASVRWKNLSVVMQSAMNAL